MQLCGVSFPACQTHPSCCSPTTDTTGPHTPVASNGWLNLGLLPQHTHEQAKWAAVKTARAALARVCLYPVLLSCVGAAG